VDILVRNNISLSNFKCIVTDKVHSPFSGGPRICVGMQFAQNEMHYFLTRICQNFSGLKTPQAVLTYKMLILMMPETEVPINFIAKEEG
jgi:cytochrome P450